MSTAALDRTPQAALATGRRALAHVKALYQRGYALSTTGTSYSARRRGEALIVRATAEIARLQREIRQLEVEAGVASLQAGLVQHMPAIQPAQRVLRRYPESQA